MNEMMKKRSFSYCLIIIVVYLLMIFFSCKDNKTTTIQEPKVHVKVDNIKGNGRAVSLKILQKRAKECASNGTCPDEILKLAGLKTINGYVVDENNNDLILIGKADETSPALYLEDFVIALRNTWMKYAELRGNTYYYSNPGCSIDPDANILKDLKKIGDQIFDGADPENIKGSLPQWNKTCSQPQQVKVLGIPYDTHFANVMVEADYYMKRLVDGSVTLDIDGFSSLSDMTMAIIREDISQGHKISVPVSSLNRFWFYPGENSFLEDNGIVSIIKSEVKLLTEEEFLTKKGEVSGTGRANSLAQIFAENFSARYASIAEQRPIYTELEGLFRFVALSRIMKKKDALADAGLNLDYLFNDCPIQNMHVARTLPGIANIKELEYKIETKKGYSVLYFWLPSCGGVSIDINIKDNDIIKNGSGRMTKMRAAVLEARQSDDSLFWDFLSLVK